MGSSRLTGVSVKSFGHARCTGCPKFPMFDSFAIDSLGVVTTELFRRWKPFGGLSNCAFLELID